MKEELVKNRNKIMPGGKSMILAYDQGFEHGPRDFLEYPKSSNFEHILDIARRGEFTGLVVQAGLAEIYASEIADSEVPLILKLNGKSELYTEDDPYSPQLCSVEEAIKLGASAVGYTVYTGSKYEGEMNREFSGIIREAHRHGVMAIGWMYPRGKSIFEGKSSSKTYKMAAKEQEESKLAIDETPSIVAYGARIGLELGADIVKVKYTGTPESFKDVVQTAYPTSVVMSGGPLTKSDEEFLSRVEDILSAGAAGIAVGRNVWQRQDPLDISHKIKRVIFGS
jgi:class I fructose-bisphosphate aldolase